VRTLVVGGPRYSDDDDDDESLARSLALVRLAARSPGTILRYGSPPFHLPPPHPHPHPLLHPRSYCKGPLRPTPSTPWTPAWKGRRSTRRDAATWIARIGRCTVQTSRQVRRARVPSRPRSASAMRSGSGRTATVSGRAIGVASAARTTSRQGPRRAIPRCATANCISGTVPGRPASGA
jgi:hypothetical protein